MIRFSLALIFFLASLLTIFHAPTFSLWEVSILSTEWGHYLAVASLLLFIPGYKKNPLAKKRAVLGLLAALLFISPLVRSMIVASRMDGEFPLSFKKLYFGKNISTSFIQGITYSTDHDTELTMDFYTPLGKPPATACVLVIHGGSWRSGDATQLSELNRYLVEKGIAVAAINYRLAPEWAFPSALDDVRTALKYLNDHATELNIDPNKIVLLGRSAGAELALLAAYNNPPLGVKGVISFYGPADLVLSYRNPGNPWVIDTFKIFDDYLGKGSPEQIPQTYFQASPINFINSKTVPTLMIHGSRDELVWALQSRRLSQKLTENKVRNTLLEMPWATHGCDYNFNGPCGQLSTRAIDDFLKEIL